MSHRDRRYAAGLMTNVRYSLPSASLRGAVWKATSMSMPSSILAGSGSIPTMFVLIVPPPSRSAIAEMKGTSIPGNARWMIENECRVPLFASLTGA